MENQGKTKKQVEDSENFVSIAVIGGIVTLIAIIVTELIFR